MIVFKLATKILLLPVIVVISVIQWLVVFLSSLSEVLTAILSFIIFLTGMASLILGLASGMEALKMILAAFVLFLIPHVGQWFVKRIVRLRRIIGNFLN